MRMWPGILPHNTGTEPVGRHTHFWPRICSALSVTGGWNPAGYIIQPPLSSGFWQSLINGWPWGGRRTKRDCRCCSHSPYVCEQLLQQWQSLPRGCPRCLRYFWSLPGDPSVWFLPLSLEWWAQVGWSYSPFFGISDLLLPV